MFHQESAELVEDNTDFFRPIARLSGTDGDSEKEMKLMPMVPSFLDRVSGT
jgi:hypothetical protein